MSRLTLAILLALMVLLPASIFLLFELRRIRRGKGNYSTQSWLLYSILPTITLAVAVGLAA